MTLLGEELVVYGWEARWIHDSMEHVMHGCVAMAVSCHSRIHVIFSMFVRYNKAIGSDSTA